MDRVYGVSGAVNSGTDMESGSEAWACEAFGRCTWAPSAITASAGVKLCSDRPTENREVRDTILSRSAGSDGSLTLCSRGSVEKVFGEWGRRQQRRVTDANV